MSNSESQSTQVIFEETKRLFEIETTEEKEEEKEEEELKKTKENKINHINYSKSMKILIKLKKA